MKILILGANGMIGNAMLRVMAEHSEWKVQGTERSNFANVKLPRALAKLVLSGIDLTNADHLSRLFVDTCPNVVINCAGLTKHLPSGNDPIQALSVNALMPHRLASLCAVAGARLIHISTDCVFSGRKGNYRESDQPDAEDVYGKTKHLGEVVGPNVLTLRTSTIGHEMNTKFGLLEWFLSKQGDCKGFSKAIFSGLPTVVFARVVRDLVISRPDLCGLYHVSAKAINKFELLKLIANIYKKQIDITPDDSYVIDRSLDGALFSTLTGYNPPEWDELIKLMHEDKIKGHA